MFTAIPTNSKSRRGFTLAELLVTIGVIVILLGIFSAAGFGAVQGQRKRTTRARLRVLDQALQVYMDANAGFPPAYRPIDYVGVPGPDAPGNNGALDGVQDFDPGLDTVDGIFPRRPDAAVFLRQTRGVGDADAVIQGLGDAMVVTVGVVPDGTPPDDIPVIAPPAWVSADADLLESLTPETDSTPSVVDAWGRASWKKDAGTGLLWPQRRQQLIYYVHPGNELAQQLYGRCQSGRPYFFSAGPDRRYGLSEDFVDPGTTNTAVLDQAKNDAVGALKDNLYSYEGVAGTHTDAGITYGEAGSPDEFRELDYR